MIYSEYGEEIQTIFPFKELNFQQPYIIFDTLTPKIRYEREIITLKGDAQVPILLTKCGLFIYVLKKNGKECGYKLTSEILNLRKLRHLPGRSTSGFSQLQMDLANFQFRLVVRDYDSGWVQGKKFHGFYHGFRI